MTLPAFLFGSVIGLQLGAVFHLWRGGGLGKLIGFIFFGESGFWVGHYAAQFWDIEFWDVGPIHIGIALLGCILFLFLGRWLMEFTKNEGRV